MYFLNNLQSYWLKSLDPIAWWILTAICWSFLTRAGSLSSSMNLGQSTLVCKFIILAGLRNARIFLIIVILVNKPGCSLRVLLKLVVVARELVFVSPDVVPGHLVHIFYQFLSIYIIYAKSFEPQRLFLCIYHSLTNTYPARRSLAPLCIFENLSTHLCKIESLFFFTKYWFDDQYPTSGA